MKLNLPNKLTIARICLIPVFVVFYFLPFNWAPWCAVAVFVLAAFTDFLDGHIARKYNLVTDLGKLLDPIADKVLSATAMFCVVATNPLRYMADFWVIAGYDGSSFATVGMIFLAVCCAVIIARELLVDVVRMIAASKGIVVQANIFGKVKTVLQDVSLPLLVVCNYCGVVVNKLVLTSFHTKSLNAWFYVEAVAVVLFFAATVMTIVSGVIYLVRNKNVFLSDAKEND